MRQTVNDLLCFKLSQEFPVFAVACKFHIFGTERFPLIMLLVLR